MVEHGPWLAFESVRGGLPNPLPAGGTGTRPKLERAAHQPRRFGIGGKGGHLILPQIEIAFGERVEARRFVGTGHRETAL
jgi:hypothetical protein